MYISSDLTQNEDRVKQPVDLCERTNRNKHPTLQIDQHQIIVVFNLAEAKCIIQVQNCRQKRQSFGFRLQ